MPQKVYAWIDRDMPLYEQIELLRKCEKETGEECYFDNVGGKEAIVYGRGKPASPSDKAMEQGIKEEFEYEKCIFPLYPTFVFGSEMFAVLERNGYKCVSIEEARKDFTNLDRVTIDAVIFYYTGYEPEVKHAYCVAYKVNYTDRKYYVIEDNNFEVEYEIKEAIKKMQG